METLARNFILRASADADAGEKIFRFRVGFLMSLHSAARKFNHLQFNAPLRS